MSELLRFATAGSVDDGKSTLIGRLLHDSKAIRFVGDPDHFRPGSTRVFAKQFSFANGRVLLSCGY